MNNLKIYSRKRSLFFFLTLGFIMSTGHVSAYSIGGDLVSSMSNWGAEVLSWFIPTFIGFLAGLGTFATLLLTFITDLFLIKVPYLGDLIGDGAGEKIYINGILKISYGILSMSVLFWAITGGWKWVSEQIDTYFGGGQVQDKWHIVKDIGQKAIVIILIFTLPVWILQAYKGINIASLWIHGLPLEPFSTEDQIIMKSKPLSSLVEMGLSLPSTDIVTTGSTLFGEKITTDLSIYTSSNTSDLSIGVIVEQIIYKSLLQIEKFKNLYDSIGLSTTADKVHNDQKNIAQIFKEKGLPALTDAEVNEYYEWKDQSSITKKLDDLTFFKSDKEIKDKKILAERRAIMKSVIEGDSELSSDDSADYNLMVYLMITIIYLVILYMVIVKLFNLVFSLITRMTKVVIMTFLLPFLFVLWASPMFNHVGKRALISYIGDLLVTPITAGILGIGSFILGVIIVALGINSDAFVLFQFTGGENSFEYVTVLIKIIILMFFLRGILNLLVNLIESVGANFEYYISKSSNGGMKDGYSNAGDALHASGTLMSLGKTGGAMAGASVGLAKSGALSSASTLSALRGGSSGGNSFGNQGESTPSSNTGAESSEKINSQKNLGFSEK